MNKIIIFLSSFLLSVASSADEGAYADSGLGENLGYEVNSKSVSLTKRTKKIKRRNKIKKRRRKLSAKMKRKRKLASKKRPKNK